MNRNLYRYPKKTWLIVKEEEAKAKFNGSEVSDGKRHLGAAVGTSHFISNAK